MQTVSHRTTSVPHLPHGGRAGRTNSRRGTRRSLLPEVKRHGTQEATVGCCFGAASKAAGTGWYASLLLPPLPARSGRSRETSNQLILWSSEISSHPEQVVKLVGSRRLPGHHHEIVGRKRCPAVVSKVTSQSAENSIQPAFPQECGFLLATTRQP